MASRCPNGLASRIVVASLAWTLALVGCGHSITAVSLDRARTQFGAQLACPYDRTAASIQPLVVTPPPPPPPEVAADPGRLAEYNRQYKEQTDAADQLDRSVEVTGCGHIQRYLCETGTNGRNSEWGTRCTQQILAPAPPATPTSATAATATASVGVKECDDYLAKWDACYRDPVKRAVAQPLFDAMKKKWMQSAADPQGREQLAAACKSALDSFPSGACN
jgi:hypothetical protein